MTQQTNHFTQLISAMLFTMLGIAVFLTANPAQASTASACTDLQSTVDSETTLNAAIACYNSMVCGAHQINIAADIVLSAVITSIDNSEGSTLTIVGNGYTLDGADSYQPLNIQSGDVTIENVTLTLLYHTFYCLCVSPHCPRMEFSVWISDFLNIILL